MRASLPPESSATTRFVGTDKGVTLTVLKGLMPPGTVEAIAPQSWGSEYRLALLAGKLLNVVNELPELEMIDTETIKCVIAGDPTTARHIREAPFQFKPRAGHIFAANRLPRTSDSSHGFWRRWIVIPFDRVVPTAKQIPELGESVLAEERPGIVNWALRGAGRLLAAGHYTIPPSSQHAIEDWRREADPVRCFLRGCAHPTRDGADGDSATTVYAEYRSYAKENGYRALARNTFGSRLRQMGYGSVHRATGNHYPFTVRSGDGSLFDDPDATGSSARAGQEGRS